MRRLLVHMFAGILATFFILLGVVPVAAQTTRSLADPPTWDYVVLGNSIGTLWFEHYGAMIESDQSVKVIYHNHYVPRQKASALLANVTSEPDLQNEIADAEIITIGIGFPDMRWAITMWGSERRNPDSEGMNEAIREFCLAYDNLLAEVISLADPTVMIQIMDVYGTVFHSTRKWFITQCERTGVPEHFTASLVGHQSARSENKLTYGLYSAGISDTQKREIIDQIRLPQEVLL